MRSAGASRATRRSRGKARALTTPAAPAALVALALAAPLAGGGCRDREKPSDGAQLPPAGDAATAPAPSADRMRVVVSAEAPLLERPDDPGRGAASLARSGDLLHVAHVAGPGPSESLRWEGLLPGEARKAKRQGARIAVRPFLEHGVVYAFASDLGPEVEVPSAGSICDALAGAGAPVPRALSAPCERFLVRKRTDAGRIVAHFGAGAGPSPVAIVSPGGARFVVVESPTSAQLVESAGRSILVASTRFSREGGGWTGSLLVPIDVSSDAPVLLPAVEIESIDARAKDEIVLRDVRAEIGEAGIRISGERKTQRRADRKTVRAEPIRETHPFRAPP